MCILMLGVEYHTFHKANILKIQKRGEQHPVYTYVREKIIIAGGSW